METIMLGIYFSFAFLAGKCTSTCCAGWQILVDKKDYERFLAIEPYWLREDILSHIRKKNGRYYFLNKEDGRCSMLDKDNLCRIQRNTEEKALCNTCRKYPRLMNQIDGTLYLSMAASCPVVAEFLLGSNVFWQKSSKKGTKQESALEASKVFGQWEKVEVKEIAVLKKVWDFYEKNREWANGVFEQKSNEDLLYGCFGKMASSVLDIVLQYQEGNSLLSFFQVFEQDISNQTKGFIKSTYSVWNTLRENYMVYRLLSRKIEFLKESVEVCYRQASGELFLLRTIAFCVYANGENLTKEKWKTLICTVYRFCAHGKKVSKAFGKITASFFTEECFWSYLIN